jgi:hypothetical protein
MPKKLNPYLFKKLNRVFRAIKIINSIKKDSIRN